MMVRFFWAVFLSTLFAAGTCRAFAGHGCPLDHFAIGQLGGEGSPTGKLFADVGELYLTHDDGTKPYPSYYRLFNSQIDNAWVNGEPGTEAIENDPQHELAGTRQIDYNIWMEVVELSENLYVNHNNHWYFPGESIHLSSQQWHHLHLDYWVYPAAQYDPGKVYYVVYRLVDELEDGQQYSPSDEFWVVFNQAVPGDFDKDGHIDQDDYRHLHEGFTGPDAVQIDPGYEDADLDDDGDVDLADFARLQRCYSGPDAHPDPRRAEATVGRVPPAFSVVGRVSPAFSVFSMGAPPLPGVGDGFYRV
ncbi:MAG: hypothetical protein KAV82_07400 [Phycisphaerae bacterium]|nr:hypothetical protein [Phycisphaerae bacterium]